jgi:hypothetical protein
MKSPNLMHHHNLVTFHTLLEMTFIPTLMQPAPMSKRYSLSVALIVKRPMVVTSCKAEARSGKRFA